MRKNNLKKFIPHFVAILLLLLLSVFFFWPFVTQKLSFIWDTREFGFTYFNEVSKYLSNFKFPLWDFRHFSGSPFAGDIESSMFYPIQWVFVLIFGVITFDELVYYFIFHFFLGSVGAYLLGHKLTGNKIASFISAVVFAFSGYALGHISHLGQVTMYTWIPLVFLTFILALEKKELFFSLLAGLTLGICALVGHYNTSIYIALGLLILLLFHLKKDRLKVFVHFIVSLLFAGLISLVLILPVFELAIQSNRAELTYLQQSETWSLNPLDLKGMIDPNAHNILNTDPLLDFNGSVDVTQNYLYIGLLPLVFIFFSLFSKGRYKWFFVSLGLISLFAAFGKFTPVNLLLFKFFPGFNKARMAVQITCMFFFSLAMLSAIGFSVVFEKFKKNRWLATALGLLACLVVVLNIFYFGFNKRFYASESPPALVFDDPVEQSFIKEIKNNENNLFRIIDERGVFELNKWRYYDVDNAWGRSGIKIKKYNDLFETKSVNAAPLNIFLYDLLNVKYVFTDQNLPSPHFSSEDINGEKVFINNFVLPRFYLVENFIIEPDELKQLELMKNGEINFRKEVLLGKDPEYFGGENSGGENSSVKVLDYFSGHIRVETNNPAKSILVLSETDYNGWNVLVDGGKSRYQTADYVFKAIGLNPGKHVVEFSYRPFSFYIGAFFSGLFFVFFIVCWIFRSIKSRRFF